MCVWRSSAHGRKTLQEHARQTTTRTRYTTNGTVGGNAGGAFLTAGRYRAFPRFGAGLSESGEPTTARSHVRAAKNRCPVNRRQCLLLNLFTCLRVAGVVSKWPGRCRA